MISSFFSCIIISVKGVVFVAFFIQIIIMANFFFVFLLIIIITTLSY